MKLFVISLVIWMIIHLRFPPGSNIISILRRRYGEPVVSKFRKLEKTRLRLEKCHLDRKFLEECVHNKLCPKFLRIKLWKSEYSRKRLYKDFQKKLLDLEIQTKVKEIDKLNIILQSCLTNLKSCVTAIDFNHIESFIDANNGKKLNKIKASHHRKLLGLGLEREREDLDPNKVVFNFSDVNLSSNVRTILAKGLKFAITPNKINFSHFLLPFEKLLRSLKNHRLFNRPPDTINHVKSSIRNLAFSTLYSFKGDYGNQNLSKSDLKELKELGKNKEVVVTRPDKGQGVVVMNRRDYISKVLEILSDHTKFQEIKDDCLSIIVHMEDKLNRLLRKFKDLKIINESTFSSLYAAGSVPGILYGLPKIHKPNLPVRPILSAIGTLNYKISKFFIPILKPLTTNNFTILDTFTFVQSILSVPEADSYIMASFDVTSLFTNVPLDETINIILESLYDNTTTINGLDKIQFKNLLDIATKNIMFYFNNKLYKQIEGVAMGSPLGPTLANIFMCHHEQRWLADCPSSFKPSYYYRYVDDTFMLFKTRDQVDSFLNYLNSKHPNIKFTCDLEQQGSLPFLDINISRENGSFITSVYRKTTYTGLTMKFDSFIPSRYKENLVTILIYRAFKIASNYFIMVKEFDFIRDILSMNGFPLHCVDGIIRRTLDRLLNTKEKLITVPKDVIVLKLPYLGHMSNSLSRKLKRIIKTHYTTLDVRTVFVNNYTIGSLFKTKDRIPISLCSSVIYNYTCGGCNASYIGKTTRNLSMHISEHRGLSYRTGRILKKPMISSIREHSHEHDHIINKENFQILDSSSFNYDLLILESLWIWKKRPTLNDYSVSTKLEILD